MFVSPDTTRDVAPLVRQMTRGEIKTVVGGAGHGGRADAGPAGARGHPNLGS
jgi:hypothetical protein